MPRYYYLSRPGAYGHQPDGFTDRNTFMPSKATPEAEGRHTFGWVEYAEPLTFEAIDKWGFWPADPVERARYAFWQEADRDAAQMQWLLDDYLGCDAEFARAEIVKEHDYNGLFAAALILKEAE